MKKTQGIYAIRNLLNEKVYVGQACEGKGVERRFIEHRTMLNKNKHFNRHLQSAWNKYGEGSFEFVVLEEVDQRSDLNSCEQKWIDQTWAHSYNMSKTVGRYEGKTQSEETKKKIAEANSKRIWTPESRQKQSQSQKGRSVPQEIREKRRLSQLGRKHSEEVKKKISLGNKGKQVSEASRAKMSASKKGIKPSQEAIANRRITFYKKPPKSGSYKGVRKRTKGSWEARLNIHDRTISLGNFRDIEEAAMNYDYHAIALFGIGNCFLNFQSKNYEEFQPKIPHSDVAEKING